MKKLMTSIAVLSAFSASSVFAGEVGSTTSFTADTPAIASEVNDNFTALITAINDNANRIAALEDGSSSGSETLMDILSDSTYRFFFLGSTIQVLENETTGNDSSSLFIEQGGSAITLHANGTLTEANGVFRDKGLSPEPAFSETFSGVGTWTLSGQELTLSFDGDPGVTLFVSPDGQFFSGSLFIESTEDESNEFETITENESEVTYAIGIRESTD